MSESADDHGWSLPLATFAEMVIAAVRKVVNDGGTLSPSEMVRVHE